MMSSRGGRYTAFLAALLSALFLFNSNNVFVAASLSNPAIATDGGPRDFTAKARKAWVAAKESSTAKKIVIGLRGGPIGRRRELFRPLLVHHASPWNRERRDHVFGRQRRREDCVARIRVPRHQKLGFRRVARARARVERRRPQRYRRHRVGDRIEQSIL